MNDELAVAGVLFAIVGPWGLGAVWLHWCLAFSGRYNIYVVLGHGYLLGMLCVALLLRGWHCALGLELEFWPLAGIVFGLTLLGVLAHRLRPAKALLQQHWEAIPRWHLALIALLMGFIVIRHFALLQMLLLQPVFSAEVLSGAAVRAIVWFHAGSLMPFVDTSAWLLQEVAAAHPLPSSAVAAPEAVSLIHLWGMLGIGAADNSFVYLPWVAVPVAMGFAIFGHLRLARVKTLHAAIVTYALLSLPALNQHTALAGYADVWLAAVFTLGVCAAYQWRITRHWSYLVLALVLASACVWQKSVGVVMAYLLLIGVAVGALRARRALLLLACGVALVLSCVPAMRLVIAGAPTDLSFMQALFSMLQDRQWHFLWLTAFLVVVVAVLRGQSGRILTAEWVMVAGGGAWALAHAGANAASAGFLDATILNAGLLVIAPSLLFCLGLLGAGLSDDA